MNNKTDKDPLKKTHYTWKRKKKEGKKNQQQASYISNFSNVIICDVIKQNELELTNIDFEM